MKKNGRGISKAEHPALTCQGDGFLAVCGGCRLIPQLISKAATLELTLYSADHSKATNHCCDVSPGLDVSLYRGLFSLLELECVDQFGTFQLFPLTLSAALTSSRLP